MSSQTATILVTDLVGSTELRARLGEEQAERLRRLHERLLRSAVETHGGVVVKWLGDGVLASFPGATEAAAAAVAIQRAADAHTSRQPELPLVLLGLPFPDLLRTSGPLGFAGRASELELLTAAWKETAGGGRRSVLVAGGARHRQDPSGRRERQGQGQLGRRHVQGRRSLRRRVVG
jgi:hypothetical protein